MTVSIDGNTILATTVSATSWTNYTATATINAGTHTLTIAITNAVSILFCNRHLFLDNVTVVAGDITPPPPPPTGTQPTGVPGNWTPAFDEEFTGSSLDTTYWEPYWYSGSALNKVTTSPSNVAPYRAGI